MTPAHPRTRAPVHPRTRAQRPSWRPPRWRRRRARTVPGAPVATRRPHGPGAPWSRALDFNGDRTGNTETVIDAEYCYD